MGKKSATKKLSRRTTGKTSPADDARRAKIVSLEAELARITGNDPTSWRSQNCPPELRESHLKDVLAFESVRSGPSLFQGLQQQGIDLPHPETLDASESADKVRDILVALSEIFVFVTGFEDLAPRQAYSLFWHQTLWEGRYVQKKTPGAITIIDASRQLSRLDLENFIQKLQGTVVN